MEVATSGQFFKGGQAETLSLHLVQTQNYVHGAIWHRHEKKPLKNFLPLNSNSVP
jgi:hypothetical protein